jgi:hypothetical protein
MELEDQESFDDFQVPRRQVRLRGDQKHGITKNHKFESRVWQLARRARKICGELTKSRGVTLNELE